MICAVVLAAGRSSRMGAQKLLLPVNGRPMIAGIVNEVRQSGVNKTFVVVGRDAAQVQAVLPDCKVAFIVNPDPGGDMLSSVRCGIRALPAGCESALVVLGDQPGVLHQLIDELISGFRKSGRGIAVPVHGGKRGHPLVFAAKYFQEVLTQYDSTGLRGLLQAYSDEVIEIAVKDRAVLEDIDTPEDYSRRQSGT